MPRKPESPEGWINKVKLLHNNKYDYSKTVFINARTSVEILCPKHGSFWQLASNHAKGEGCRKCALENTHEKIRKHKVPSEILQVWTGMMARCYNSNEQGYKNYGGRGIVVCFNWRNSSENFYKDIGDRPSNTYSIERNDVNRHYSCGHCEECLRNQWISNCKWATWEEQMRNKRNSLKIEFKGQIKSIIEWAKIYDIPYTCLVYRAKQKWPIEKLFIKSSKGNGFSARKRNKNEY